MITEIIKKLINKTDLVESEALDAMKNIMDGQVSEAEIAAFLIALRMKGETTSEVSSLASVMRSRSEQIHPEVKNLTDTCGTGGDHSNTFNISTTVAFVLAGAGVPVAKHGNRAASSKSGSADVLEALGVKIDLLPSTVEQCIEEIGIGFMFAPLFHSSMKNVVPVRKQLKVRTIFNILGPLTNPANAQNQVIGVFDPDLTEFMAHVLKKLGSRHAMIVHGDGLDEISTTGSNKISELTEDEIKTYEFNPADYGIPRATKHDLTGGDAQENAEITLEILKNSDTEEISPKKDIVIINAAASLIESAEPDNWPDAIDLAKASISTGSALSKLEELIEFTNNT